MPAGQNVLSVALAAGLPLPHSCRGGRCASCKATLLSGEVAYPDDRLPPGIVAAEVARGEVLLCQAQPLSDLHVRTRLAGAPLGPACAVFVESEAPLPAGGARVTLRLLAEPASSARPGQYVDVENATGERERVAVVAVSPGILEVEVLDFAPEHIVRMRGPFDAPR